MSFSCFYIEKLEKGDSTKLAGSYIYCSSRSVHSHTEIDNHNLSYGEHKFSRESNN